MRINPISTRPISTIGKLYKTGPTDPTVQQPIATDSVQFKGYNRVFESLKTNVQRGKNLKFIETRNGKYHNENTLKNYMSDIYRSLIQIPQCYKHPKFDEIILPYFENRWTNAFGEIAGKFNLNKTGDTLVLIKDHEGLPYCILRNFGPYFFQGKPQSALIFANPDADEYVGFSNGYENSIAITTTHGRHELYTGYTDKGRQYKAFTKENDFIAPLYYEKYYNEDGSTNKVHKFFKFIRDL